ncbi:NAD-binding protein [Schizopora paradoxa]|uniref:NAD-binding protein n=1 Tax=Schizopora paradoxa TaxID=27342 RepID=A0A0H2SJ43_9AGAM|nr:NAD-binding protein [Schizopora paradoxa]
MSKQKIFLTGATGFIGGAVLWRLLSHKDAKDFSFKVLVRSSEKAKLLCDKFGVEAVVGSLADLDKLEKFSEEADYVFAIADVDDLKAAQAVVKGLKNKFDKTGQKGILIHTSGTGVLADQAAGLYTGEKVYNDANPDDIESLPLTQVHRPVDVAVIDAGKAGYAKTYIICPSTIYGVVSNPLVDAGIQNPHSIQIPQIIRAGIDRGQGGMVGLGENLWPNVWVDDVADLYIVLFDRIRADPEGTPNGREGYYFGASGEHSLYDVCKKIAEVLAQKGKGQSAEPTTFTQADLDKYFDGSAYLGSNSRCIAERSLSIGWKPKKSTPDFLASIEPEVTALLIRDAGKGYIPRADGGKSKD